MTRTREWCFLSDLHLRGSPGSRGMDEALPRFLATVLGTSTADERTLVLLGDTFDLSGATRLTDSAVRERLVGLAAAHGAVLRTLGECVQSGTALHVVGGNHDIELTRPPVADIFARLLGTQPGDPRLRFSPWLVHEPGVFYAEHGNQHHDLNRVPTVLSVRQLVDGRDLPVTPLGALARRDHADGGDARSRVGRIAQSLQEARRHERLVASAWYQALLQKEARSVALSSSVLAELAGISRFSLTGSGARVTRRIVARRLGREPAGTYLAPQAAAIHRTLVSHGLPVPAYVFGHTHRAERLTIAGEPSAAYLNAGTWSDDVRGDGPDRDDPRVFPYVTVTDDGSDVHADVHFWDAGRQPRKS